MPMSHNVSDSEWTLIKILERAIWPMLIAGAIGGFTAFSKLQAAQAETTTKVVSIQDERVELKGEVKGIKDAVAAVKESQHQTEVTVERIETNQQHLKEDVQEILHILRSNGNGH